MAPWVQTTILPAMSADCAASNVLQSPLPKDAASMSGSGPTPEVIDMPKISGCAVAPPDSWTRPVGRRSWVLAPTDITHGAFEGLPIVCGLGPALPAEAATKTPAACVPKNGWPRIPVHGRSSLRRSKS